MHSKRRKKDILTIPNLLSLMRLLLIPVYVSVYLRASKPQDYLIAGGILGLSCLTDCVDGWIARKYHMISVLGTILDPIADKATQLVLTWCLSIHYPALRFVLALLVIKECFQLTAGVLFLLHRKMLSGALLSGKICTTVLFISLIALVLFPATPQHIVEILAFTDIFFLGFSFISYVFAYYGKDKKVQDLPAE